ncbi:MAG: hypothetical protein DCO96_12625 [Fluviicola sp. XM-24bin1]|nr:MAG: hypothetical protein DCO96_12625 [Fluviicola sp. XM-24bin1]
MEVLKFERTISRIDDPSVLSFDDTTYLWVIHANKIPPHLGISQGDEFYSLKANGKDEGLPVSKLIQVLQRKSIATAFFEIQSEAIVQAPKEVFAQYETTTPGEITCLAPLKQILRIADATWLKELLAELEMKEAIQSAHGWQLPLDFEQIPDYNPQDIHRRLKQLQDVQS